MAAVSVSGEASRAQPGTARDIDMDADVAENKLSTLLFDNELKNESSC